MVMSFSWMRSTFVAILLGLTVSACGYNSIPTAEEQAKAKWADVQNNYQRRPISFPISLRRCRATPNRSARF